MLCSGSLGKIPVFGLPAEGIKQFEESVEQGAALAGDVVEPSDRDRAF